MQPVSAFVVFVIIWWLVLFCVLPVGRDTQHVIEDSEKGIRAPGAPKNFNLFKVLKITSLITFILWILALIIIHMEIVDFRDYVS